MNEQLTAKKPVAPDRYDDEWITKAWGDASRSELFDNKRLTPRPRVSRALDLCQIDADTKVLDIACGRGEVVALASERGAFAVGLDFSPAVLEVARKVRSARAPKLTGSATLELIQADACRLPFAHDSFDRIAMLDIIEHLVPDQLEQMFREVHRVLKPGGYAVIHTLPNRWVYEVGYLLARLLVRRLPREPRGEMERQVHVNEQDLRGLSRTLHKCGLKHRVWLEQHMPAQARWNVNCAHFQDNRDLTYPLLARWPGKILELLSHTPLKLIIANDIYGILWKSARKSAPVRVPSALVESVTCFGTTES